MWKLALVFALIVFLLSRRWNLAYVLLLGSALLGLLYDLAPLAILHQAGIAAIDLKTLRLVAAVLLITALGELMREVQSMQRLVDSLQTLVRDPKLVLAIIPALIGLLPMPGGAMMSAPMVAELGTQLQLTAERKTYLNYWFRHVWEYVFPLYPALILLSGIVSIPLSRLAIAMAPLTTAAICAGILVGLRGMRRQGKGPSQVSRLRRQESLRQLGLSIWPIVVVIVLGLGLQLELALSLIVALSLMALIHRIRLRTLAAVLLKSLSPRRALLVFSIMIFNQMVSASGAAASASATFAAWGISPIVTCSAVPLLVGLLTGLSLPMVGITFPVLMPLVSGHEHYVGLVALAYSAGFAGVLLSPVHLCLALTREYFEAAWTPLYRLLAPSVAMLALGAAIALVIA
jgi:integral membrane protein (TIGR00529 family)